MKQNEIKVFFSDFFNVKPETVENYGAFNVSLVADLPLFIDPFLLFTSKNAEYQRLHAGIIDYLRFLKDKSADKNLDTGLILALYKFPEVKQNWFGFSAEGNSGSGLGKKFADALHTNLNKIFGNFGTEKVTRGSHLEKLCLVREGVGRDNISDFTTNLIHEFLLEYTQRFAKKHIHKKFRKNFTVSRVHFDYNTETWERRSYELPVLNRDYVLLTPRDILTRDDTWINKTDLIREFEDIPDAIPNAQLRSQINNYFRKALPKKPTVKDEREAALKTVLQFPEMVDYYIKYKEENGDRATNLSSQKVASSRQLYVAQFSQLPELLNSLSGFYKIVGNTYEEAHKRVGFLKDVIENKGGHRIFWNKNKSIEREEDVHILYRMTWFATTSDVSREVNDGRGPADFKISKGSRDKSIVEFKLAKNSQLRRNLEKQAEIYEKASDAQQSIKVIVYFKRAERQKVERILKDLKMSTNKDVVLIDARKDNKPSASKA